MYLVTSPRLPAFSFLINMLLKYNFDAQMSIRLINALFSVITMLKLMRCYNLQKGYITNSYTCFNYKKI
jgi:hypothetical protein